MMVPFPMYRPSTNTFASLSWVLTVMVSWEGPNTVAHPFSSKRETAAVIKNLFMLIGSHL